MHAYLHQAGRQAGHYFDDWNDGPIDASSDWLARVVTTEGQM
jgi:hypothetical protein